MTDTKTCKTCGKTKPLSEFSKRSDNGLYRLSCKECRHKQAHEKWLKKKVIIEQERIRHPRTTKKCSVCHQEKPFTEFDINERTGNRQKRCRECVARIKREYDKNSKMMVCVTCGKRKHATEFSRRSDNGLYRRSCKECRHEQAHKKWQEEYAEILKEREKYARLHPITSKVCTVCHKEKPLDEFYVRKDTGVRYSRCYECVAKLRKKYYEANKERIQAWNREYGKQYRADPKNKERLSLIGKQYYEANKEAVQARHRKNHIRYYQEHKDELREKDRRYREENRDKINARTRRYEKERRDNDPLFKLTKQMRTLVNSALTRKGYKKNTKTEALVGCTTEELITHLLKTYKDNYGVEWDGVEPVHIDHIVPLSGMTEQEIIKAQHYTNLQLLKAHDNLVKHDSKEWELSKGGDSE